MVSFSGAAAARNRCSSRSVGSGPQPIPIGGNYEGAGPQCTGRRRPCSGDHGVRPGDSSPDLPLRPGTARWPGGAGVRLPSASGILRPAAGPRSASGAPHQRNPARDGTHLRAHALFAWRLCDEPLHSHRAGRREEGVLVRRLRRETGAAVHIPERHRLMKNIWPILIVDDEEVMCESMAAWLREDGYRVDTAPNGRQALNLARSTDYAIYFVDLKMPGGMDGI